MKKGRWRGSGLLLLALAPMLHPARAIKRVGLSFKCRAFAALAAAASANSLSSLRLAQE